MNEELTRWCEILANWANSKPEIAEVWIFGSRARGDQRDDSDLDVALIMSGKDQGTRFGNYIALADEWREEVTHILPVVVDLDIGDRDISTKIVAPALAREGRIIYSRGN